MAQAEILYDFDMKGWPPKTYLVKLSEPMRRFDPETGEPEDFEFVALCCKESDPKAAYVFPSTEDGRFVDHSMIPIRTRDFGLPGSVLAQLDYTLTN